MLVKKTDVIDAYSFISSYAFKKSFLGKYDKKIYPNKINEKNVIYKTIVFHSHQNIDYLLVYLVVKLYRFMIEN